MRETFSKESAMRLLLSLLLGLSLPAFAQHDHHASPPPATARSAPLRLW